MMKKTNKKASIAQYNKQTCKYTTIERKVFEDEDGKQFVKINGEAFTVEWLILHDYKVIVYQD